MEASLWASIFCGGEVGLLITLLGIGVPGVPTPEGPLIPLQPSSSPGEK